MFEVPIIYEDKDSCNFFAFNPEASFFEKLCEEDGK